MKSNFVQGPKAKVWLADLRKESAALVAVDPCRLWILPDTVPAVLHKWRVIYAYYQHWGDVQAATGVLVSKVDRMRRGTHTLSRGSLEKIDAEYRLCVARISLNIAENRRIDEGSPALLRWRQKRRAEAVQKKRIAAARKKRSGHYKHPKKDLPCV